NVTFTRRVDHEAGKHRGAMAGKDHRVCERCGAVYVKRRWILAGTLRAASLQTTATRTVCPACQMIADGRFAGEIRLSGAFLADHAGDVDALIHNEAERAAVDNPTG